MNPLLIFFTLFMLLVLAQSLFNLYMTLYAWDNPDRLLAGKAPKSFEKPHYGFTVFLPVRHEKDVIGDTLIKLSKLNYPKKLVELLVLCTPDDIETIAAAELAIKSHKIKNARILAFKGKAGKSRGMNAGLKDAKHPFITIFDAEDDVSEDLFNIANTIYLRHQVDVLQCGVQLMDYDNRWFSAHNVLEYYFWFKSRMHFQAYHNLVPLGGNSVFFKTTDLRKIGGWDEEGLTEDADIGIRLSALGKKFRVCYDKSHVTKEETPHTAAAFIKQRTRWIQGFLQILKKREYMLLPRKERWMAIYVLTSAIMMVLLYALTPLLIALGISQKMPAGISLLSFLPLFTVILYIVVSLVGLYEFGKEQKIKIKIKDYFILVATFYPYQVLLMIAGVRALFREITGSVGWEKTAHAGNHRQKTQVSTE